MSCIAQLHLIAQHMHNIMRIYEFFFVAALRQREIIYEPAVLVCSFSVLCMNRLCRKRVSTLSYEADQITFTECLRHGLVVPTVSVEFKTSQGRCLSRPLHQEKKRNSTAL